MEGTVQMPVTSTPPMPCP